MEKISQVILKLSKIMERHGDIPTLCMREDGTASPVVYALSEAAEAVLVLTLSAEEPEYDE